MKDLCLTTYTEKIAPKVFRENVKQLEKWGVQDHLLSEWLMFAAEELGETADAIGEWQFRGGIPEEVIKEAIQTATLMLKIAEMFNALLVVTRLEAKHD